jgi:hypothetical protein
MGVRYGGWSGPLPVGAGRRHQAETGELVGSSWRWEKGGVPGAWAAAWRLVGRCGPAREHSALFHLIQIFKQSRICNGSKHIFPCSKNSK